MIPTETVNKARQIVDSGDIELIADYRRSTQFQVHSQSGDKTYTVDFKSREDKRRVEMLCSCPHGLTDGANQGFCKHKVAVFLYIDDEIDTVTALNQQI